MPSKKPVAQRSRKNREVTSEQKAYVRAKYSESKKPVNERYKDEIKKIEKEKKAYEYQRKPIPRLLGKLSTSASTTQSSRPTRRQAITFKSNNNGLGRMYQLKIDKNSKNDLKRFVESVTGNVSKRQAKAVESFISTIAFDYLQKSINEQAKLIETIKTYVSIGKTIYKVIVFINEKRQIVIQEGFQLAKYDDTDDYNRFITYHQKVISKYYGDVNSFGEINDIQKTGAIKSTKLSILDDFIHGKKEKLTKLKQLVGEELIDEDIFIQAITCSGFAKEYNDVSSEKILDHDGLATVGDSVLKTLICESLFRKDKSISKGYLTDKKRDLENNPKLQKIGLELDIGSLLFQRNSELKGNKKIATAIEAIIGAIYLSNGYDCARNFAVKYLM